MLVIASLFLFMLVFAKRSSSEFLLTKTQNIHTHPLSLLIETVIKKSEVVRHDDQLARSQLTLILKVVSFISIVFIYSAFISCLWRVNHGWLFLAAPDARTSDTRSYSDPRNNLRHVTLSVHFHSAARILLSARCELFGSLQRSSTTFCSTRIFPLPGARYWSSQASAEMIRPYIKECESWIWFLMLSSFVRRCRSYGDSSFRGG